MLAIIETITCYFKNDYLFFWEHGETVCRDIHTTQINLSVLTALGIRSTALAGASDDCEGRDNDQEWTTQDACFMLLHHHLALDLTLPADMSENIQKCR